MNFLQFSQNHIFVIFTIFVSESFIIALFMAPKFFLNTSTVFFFVSDLLLQKRDERDGSDSLDPAHEMQYAVFTGRPAASFLF